ncbi:unnamed protein product [Dibothriocephalus latus]|uniref:CS domain-containing protein n=1 Tax=Dibothriocephalus latus TaxID=60516 RepID=A0A3P7LG74_DIBLA|nr:unnamed protein product [Dibothriocephalus latus]
MSKSNRVVGSLHQVAIDIRVLILINLDKVNELWWEAAFVDEERIDVQEIDCSRPMHELDEESQAKIAQMLFDQEQKRLGLPTSEEQKIQDILKGAWNKDGSPFKGTAYDPNLVKPAGAGGPGGMPMPPPGSSDHGPVLCGANFVAVLNAYTCPPPSQWLHRNGKVGLYGDRYTLLVSVLRAGKQFFSCDFRAMSTHILPTEIEY